MGLLITLLEMWHVEKWLMTLSSVTAILNKLLPIENICNLFLTMVIKWPWALLLLSLLLPFAFYYQTLQIGRTA